MHLREQTIMEIIEEERLHERYRELRARAERWQSRAALATRRGLDDLAREALARRRHYLAQSEAFLAEYDRQRRRVVMLKRRLQQIEAGQTSVEDSRRGDKIVEVLAVVDDPIADQLEALERDDRLDRQLQALKARIGAEGH